MQGIKIDLRLFGIHSFKSWQWDSVKFVVSVLAVYEVPDNIDASLKIYGETLADAKNWPRSMANGPLNDTMLNSRCAGFVC